MRVNLFNTLCSMHERYLSQNKHQTYDIVFTKILVYPAKIKHLQCRFAES